MFRTLIFSVAVIAASAGATSQTTICDAMADRLRSDSEFLSGAPQLGAFDRLLKIGVITEPKGEYLDSAAVIDRLHLTGEAAKAADELLLSKGMLFTLDHHAMLMEEGGTANCQSFAFFSVARGKPRLLAQPSMWMDGGLSDEGDSISECYGNWGHLARVERVDGFFAVHGGYLGFSSLIDFAPLKNGKWGSGCSLEIDTETLFPIKTIEIAKNGTIQRETLETLAPEIARAFHKKREGKTFEFGRQLPNAELQRLNAFAAEVDSGYRHLPQDEYSESQEGYSTDELIPIAVDGHGYLVRIAHPTIGWRDLRGMLLTFYAPNSDKLEIAANVVLEEKAGVVQSIKVRMRP